MTDYSIKECRTIKATLLGRNQGQSHWFGLASFAGHIDPEMTFKHYIHTAYIIAGLQQHDVKIDFPQLLLEKLTGLDYQKTYHIHASCYNKDSKTIHLSLLRQHFAKTLCENKSKIFPSLEKALAFDSTSPNDIANELYQTHKI